MMKNSQGIKKFMYIVILLLLPSLIIELLSGSTPPVNYMNLISIVFLAIAYGVTLMFLRELKVRWQLTWQFMFLVPIMGIYIEGFFMQSFFNSAHEDLDLLSNVGVFLGVQWVWAINLIVLHGIFAVVLPLFIMDFIFPSMKHKPMLNKVSGTIFGLLLIGLTALQLNSISIHEYPMYADYDINILYNLVWVMVTLLLIVLVYIFRYKSVQKKGTFTNKKRHHFYGFIYFIMLLIATYFLLPNHVLIVLGAQVILVVLLIVFSMHYIYKSNRQTADFLPLFNGTMAYFIMLAILQGYDIIENVDPTYGMEYVGYVFALFVIVLNWIGYLNRQKKDGETLHF